jgi:hypothetical protein
LGAALVAGCLSTQAQALTTNWGALTPTVTQVVSNATAPLGTLHSGSFTDVYKFTLNSAADLDSAVLNFNLLSLTHIKYFTLWLVDCGADGNSTTCNPSTDGNLDSEVGPNTILPSILTLSFSGLTPGVHYGFLVTGKVTGLLGGAYLGHVTLSAVPVPAAVWLFVSGLVGLVVFVRRRRTPDALPVASA